MNRRLPHTTHFDRSSLPQVQAPELFINGELTLGTSSVTSGTCFDLYHWFDDTLKGVTKDEFCKVKS